MNWRFKLGPGHVHINVLSHSGASVHIEKALMSGCLMMGPTRLLFAPNTDLDRMMARVAHYVRSRGPVSELRVVLVALRSPSCEAVVNEPAWVARADVDTMHCAVVMLLALPSFVLPSHKASSAVAVPWHLDWTVSGMASHVVTCLLLSGSL